MHAASGMEEELDDGRVLPLVRAFSLPAVHLQSMN